MKLYHGSDVIVKNPIIKLNQRALDFGSGFYLTSSLSQAEKWAKIVKLRRRSANAIVNAYNYYDNDLTDLCVLRFDKPDSAWLNFVVAHRKELMPYSEYDIVIGPVANDATLPVIDDYMDGKYTQEEAVKRLLPQKLTDQYAFLTPKALEYITFLESVAL